MMLCQQRGNGKSYVTGSGYGYFYILIHDYYFICLFM